LIPLPEEWSLLHAQECYQSACELAGVDPDPKRLRGPSLIAYRNLALPAVLRHRRRSTIIDRDLWGWTFALKLDVLRTAALLQWSVTNASARSLAEPWREWRRENRVPRLRFDGRGYSSPLGAELLFGQEMLASIVAGFDHVGPVNRLGLQGWLIDQERRGASVEVRVNLPRQPIPAATVQDGLADLVVINDRQAHQSVDSAELFTVTVKRIRAAADKAFADIEAAIAKARVDVAGAATDPGAALVSDKGGNIALTRNDLKIFRALQRIYPATMQQYDLADATRLSRGTVGRRLEQLRAWGLVERPRGDRQGNTITMKGLGLLKDQSAN
jgi:hypothetical protein